MKTTTTSGKKKGGHKQQLSKVSIQNKIRPHVPNLIEKALYIAEHGDSDSNKLGAIKMLLSKVVPDLKAVEVDGELNLKQYVVAIPTENHLDTPQGTTDRSTKES